MPSGGVRKSKKEMEELDCIGHLAVERPHKFKRLKGSGRRQCDHCWNTSINVHAMPVLECQERIIHIASLL